MSMNKSTDIEDVEAAFTLRQFDKALLSTNQILWNAHRDRNVGNGSNIQLQSNNDLVFDVPMNDPFKPYMIKPSSQQQAPGQVPLTETLPSIPFNFRIGISTTSHREESISIQDRAATIAIQCTYELWKERRRGGNNDTGPLIDSKLQKDIQPFLHLYGTSTSTNCQKSHHLHRMSFDLLFLWIQFLYTIGLQTTCIEMILCVIDVVFLSINDDRDCTDTSIEQNLYTCDYDEDQDEVEGKHHSENNSIVQVLEYKFKSEADDKMEASNHNIDHDICDDENEYDIDEHEYEYEHVLYNYCYNIFNFLLLEILPFIQNKDALEKITNELCIILTRRVFNHHHHSDTKGQHRLANIGIIMRDGGSKKMSLSSKPLLSSVMKISQTIEAILSYTRDDIRIEGRGTKGQEELFIKLIPMFVKECIKDCLEDIYMLQEQLEEIKFDGTCEGNDDTHQSSSTCSMNTSNNFLPSILNSLTSRLLDNRDQEEVEANKEEEEKEEKRSLFPSLQKKIAKEYIVQPLWESEERWMNRGIVLVAGVFTYSILWRRRRQVMNVTKCVRGTLLSPFREIASALKSP